jgi:hypothetical protein
MNILVAAETEVYLSSEFRLSVRPARMRNGRENRRLGLRFSWLFIFGVLRDAFGENKSLLEAAINLAQFPEDREKKNRHYEQQELDIHFSSLAPTSLTAVVRRCAC